MITLERKDARKDGLNELNIVCESGHWKVIADGEFSGFWGCMCLVELLSSGYWMDEEGKHWVIK